MKLTRQDDNLTIELEGAEKFWALKSRLQVPRAAISDVTYTMERQVMQDAWGYLRLVGTRLPGRLLAGTYWRQKDREFWFVRDKQPGMMTLTLKKGASPYRRVLLSCPPQTAQDVKDWWQKR